MPMKIVSCELPMSGRNTMRSAPTATTHITTAVTASAAARPTCIVSPTTVRAAKSVIAPCAKLKTEEAL